MCGIGFVRRMKGANTPILPQMVHGLMLGIQHRGADAAGIAIMRKDKKLVYHKDDSIAWKFLGKVDTQNFLEEHLPLAEIVILHTRAWTKGNPSRNVNNHPLTAGKVAVVHNGIVYNDDMLFEKLQLDRTAETDSDIIRAILDKHGLTPAGVKVLRELRGSAAICAISPESPDKLLLAKCSNPLELAAMPDEGILMGASEKGPLHAASKGRLEKWGMTFQANCVNLRFNPFQPESAFIIGPEGVEWTGEFKFTHTATSVTNHRVHDRFMEKNIKKNEEIRQLLAEKVAASAKEEESGEGAGQVVVNPDSVRCPNPLCSKWCTIPPQHRTVPMWKLSCGKCSQGLASPPKEMTV